MLKEYTNSCLKHKTKHKMNEEAVKHHLVLPFIRFMGYDFTDPSQVQPEYLIKSKNNNYRVDYALMETQLPLVFIEVKHSKDLLTSHIKQITKYFNSTPSVIILILTNGFIYKFFTDLDENSKIDAKEFFKCDIRQLTDYHEKILNQLKDVVAQCPDVISKTRELAHDNRHLADLISLLSNAIENPNSKTIKFILAHKEEIVGLQKKSILQQFDEKYVKICKNIQ